MSKEFTRRNFLQGGALIAGGLAGGALLSGMGASKAFAEEAQGEATSTASDASAETASNGRFRPEVNSRKHPTPMHTGYIGPDAQPIMPLDPPDAWDEEYDVVVVGSGYGGLTAAVIGAENGLSVTLLEKGDVTGGASRHAAANIILSGGARLQEERGYHWPGDRYDPKAAAAKYQGYCSNTVDDQLLLATIEGGKNWADWMTDQPGIDWECTGPRFIDKKVFYAGSDHYQRNELLGNNDIVNALTDNATAAGVDIKLLTECVALVQENGRVVGVKISDIHDNESFVKAHKAVLLTAGGMGNNIDLLEQYAPTAYMYATQGGPVPSHTGECFRMGIGMGADVSGFNSFSMWEGGLDEYWGNGDGQFFHYFWEGAKQVAQNPWLKIDKAGNRLSFITVKTADGVDIENWDHPDYGQIGDLTNANIWSAAIGHRAYNIFDANFKETLEIFKETAQSAEDLHRYPLTEADNALPNSLASTDWEKEFEEAVERGAVSKADTLEELAEMMGLNPDKVVAAVDHWNNEICAKGEDTDLSMPYKKAWLIPVDTPPYYGIAVGGQVSKVMAGLRVNPKMQVINEEGDPIPGLYAGWYTAGGICGENNYGGEFGNPTLHGGVAISGVGGYMAIHGILETE